MNVVVIRTKLQAVIVRKMVEEQLIRGPIHLVQLHEDEADLSRDDLSHQRDLLGPSVVKATTLARRTLGTAGLFFYFLWLLYGCRFLSCRLYYANINWFPFALALKLAPGQRFFSYDDGTANIQVRDDSYLSEKPSTRRGMAGWMARRLFPKGCAQYARNRIARHCTIYPGTANVVPPSRLDTVQIDWERLIESRDAATLPAGVRRIFIGSVYRELNRRPGITVSAEDVEAAIRWADMHIPHPRQAAKSFRDDVLVKYPAEAIIGHYATLDKIVVAHYNSSAAVPFRRHPNVRLVDLLDPQEATLIGREDAPAPAR